MLRPMKIAGGQAPEPVFQPFPRRRRSGVLPTRSRMWSVSTWIIVINVVIFVADTASRGLLTHWGSFSVVGGFRHLQLWRLITFQFLHVGPLHLIFNMLWLYFLGPIVEPWLGKRRFVAFYLACGVASALTAALLVLTHLLSGKRPTHGWSAHPAASWV